MNARLRRWMTLIFTLMLLVTPYGGALAEDPVGNISGQTSDPEIAATPVIESSPESQSPVAPLAAEDTGIGVQSISGTYTYATPFFDVATNTLNISVTFDDGFSAAAGDSIVMEYGWSLELQPSSQATLTNIPQASVALDADNLKVIITFTEAYSVAGTSVTGTIAFPGEVYWLQCSTSVEPYTPSGDIWFFLPPSSSYASQTVTAAEECPGITAPTISWMDYDADTGDLEIEVLFSGPNAAGEQVTLTYPVDKMVVSPGPVTVTRYSYELDRQVPVGTATASNGLITISFFDTGLGDVDWTDYTELSMEAWLISGTCSDSGERQIIDVGDLTFVSNTGEEFVENVEVMLCNAAPMTKTGVFGTNVFGDPIITWTIDTGDVIGGAYIWDYMDDEALSIECSDPGIMVDVVSGSFSQDDVWCQPWGFDFPLYGSDTGDGPQIVRATITFVTTIDTSMERNVYMNCAETASMGGENPSLARTSGSNGLGGEACFELFPENGGDFITKTVDKAIANPGETITYTVTASTTADNWNQINLIDPLPAGFAVDPTSITCVVEPAIFAVDPCYTLTDGQLVSSAVQMFDDSEENWGWHSGPVTITITMKGTVTAAQGETITNEACVERIIQGGGEGPDLAAMNMGDPTVPGGGIICASAVTTVPGPTPSPSPTPTTVPVTRLPETGNGATGSSATLMVLASGAMLMAAVVGVRLRTGRE